MSRAQKTRSRRRTAGHIALLAVIVLSAVLTACARDTGDAAGPSTPPIELGDGTGVAVAPVNQRGAYPLIQAVWGGDGLRLDACLEFQWTPDADSPGHPVDWTVVRPFTGIYQESGAASAEVPFMAFPGDRIDVRLSMRTPGGEAFVAREAQYVVPSLPPLQTSSMPTPDTGEALGFNFSTYWYNTTDSPLPELPEFAGMNVAMSMHNVGDHHYSCTSSGAFDELLAAARGSGDRLVWLQYMMAHGITTDADQSPTGSIPARLYAAMCGPAGSETYPMIAKDTSGQPLDGCPSFCHEWEANPLAPGFVDSIVTIYAEEHVRGGLARWPWVGVLVDYLDATWANWRCAGGDCASVVDLDQDGVPFSADGDEQQALVEANEQLLVRLRAVMDHVRGDETFLIVCNGDMARNSGAAALMDGEVIERMDMSGSPERTWNGLKKVLLDMPDQFTHARLPYRMVYMGIDGNDDLRHVLAVIGRGTRGRTCHPEDNSWYEHPNVCPDESHVQLGEVASVSVDEDTRTITAACENGWAAVRWSTAYPWPYIAVETSRAAPDTVLRGGGWPRQQP